MSKRYALPFISFFLFTLVVLCPVNSSAQTVRQDLWVTNGPVYDQKLVGDTLYVGGQFDSIGPATGPFGVADSGTGEVTAGLPKVRGTVKAIAPDGAGGWFVGGKFDSVGGVTVYNLAHIRADKTVDTNWSPNPSHGMLDDVKDIEVSGGTVYVCGAFNTIGGQPRKGLAALDAATGAATVWNPNPSGSVLEVEIAGGRLYAGGTITAVGVTPRGGMAAFDLSTGSLLDWNPSLTWNANSTESGVRAIAVAGGTVYAGGSFSGAGGQARSGLAAFDATTAAPVNWNPAPQHANNPLVEALAVDGGTLYVGGRFTEIGGQPRSYIASFDTATGALNDWNPHAGVPDGEVVDWRGAFVSSVVVRPEAVYVGGAFRSIGGEHRRCVAALDKATGRATPWRADAGVVVYALRAEGSAVAAGGSFNSLGGVRRVNLAALDLKTGRATDWDARVEPTINGAVKVLAVGDSTLYLTGGFSRVGGAARTNIAEVSLATGLATSWNPTQAANLSNVSVMAAVSSTLYVGGGFTVYSGTTQLSNLVGLSRTSGALTGFAPGPDGGVADFAISGTTLYAAGNFFRVGGQERVNVAAFDLTTGRLKDWKVDFLPQSNETYAAAVRVSGGRVFVGGHLPEISYTPSPGAPPTSYNYLLAAFDQTTGRLIPDWHPQVNFWVQEIEVVGATCYIAGPFWQVNGQDQFAAAAVHADTGELADWNLFRRSDYSGGDGVVNRFAVKDGVVYMAGKLTNVKGSGHSYVVGVTPPVLSNVNPTVALSVTADGKTTLAPASVAVRADTTLSLSADAADADGATAKVDFYTGSTLLGTDAAAPFAFSTDQLAAGEYVLKAVATDDRGGTGESAVIRLTVLGPLEQLSVGGRVVDQDGVGLAGVAVKLGGAGSATTLTDAGGHYVFDNLTPGSGYSVAAALAGYDFQPEGYGYASLGANEDASFVAYRQTSANEYTSNLWIPNGAVRASAVRGDTLYIGGDFTSLRGIGRHGAAVSAVTGAVDQRFGRLNGKIYAAAPDGAGGWFVGGTFTSARVGEGDVERRNLAHLLADGSLDEAWNPGANGRVSALEVVGTTLYVGGGFTEVGGQPRKGLAALDKATGALKPFDARLSMAARSGVPVEVNALLVGGGHLVAGGVFDTAGGGVDRANLAQFDLATGALTEWTLGARSMGEVRCVALDADTGTLYVGGIVFFDGESQGRHLAAFDAATGARRPGFNPPRPGGYLDSLAVVGNNLFIAGAFSGLQEEVNGQTLTYFRAGGVAMLDATTGAVREWSPVLKAGNTGARTNVLFAAGPTLYVGGEFTHAGGEGSAPATESQTRTGLAAYDAATGALKPWNPVTGGDVTAFAVNGTTLFVGAAPTNKGLTRKHLAALDINTGQPTDWNPGADGPVVDLALGDGSLYVVGGFKTVGGVRHDKAAEVELATGRVTEWNPSASLDAFADPPPTPFEAPAPPAVKLNSIAVVGDRVLLGGKFDAPASNLDRPALVAVERATGRPLNWDAGFAAGSEVRDVLVDGDTVYVGGRFVTVGGQTRQNLAALNAQNAQVTSWGAAVKLDGDASKAHVSALAIAGGSMYVGGDFTGVGGQPRRDLAEVSLQTAEPTLWNPDVKPLQAGGPSYVESVSVTGSLVYAGGNFGLVGTSERSGLAAVDRGTGLASAWSPQLSGGDVLTITTSPFGSKIFMGGSFTQALGLGADRAHLVGVRNPDPLSLNIAPEVILTGPSGVMQSGKPDEGGAAARSFSMAAANAELYRVRANADASDDDGQVSRVEFYNNTTLLGTDTAAPFSFEWHGVPAGTYTLSARAYDNKGASTTSRPITVNVPDAPTPTPTPTPGPVQSPYGGTVASLPGQFEAENFDDGGEGVSYHDVTAANEGGAYRQTGVDIYRCADGGCGRIVGWVKAGEWLEYTVQVAAGTYDFEARVSSAAAGARFRVEVDGADVTGPLQIPNTGGSFNWASVSKAGVSLTAGTHVVRVFVEAEGANGWGGNFDWFRFADSRNQPLPVRVQAEDFDAGGEGTAYHDTTAANEGGAYRQTGVDVYRCTDGGCDNLVGWVKAGEWLKYTADINSPGLYTLRAKVSNGAAGATFHVEVDGADVTGPLQIPNTGGTFTWQTVSREGLSLPAGRRSVRLVMDAEAQHGWVGNFDWFEFVPAAAPQVLVEAEDFDAGAEGAAYHDVTAANEGGAYRQTGVDVYRCTDDTCGHLVGWIKAGEWLRYTADITSGGVYTFEARVSNGAAGGTFHVEVDGVDVTGPLQVPDTGGTFVWQPVTRAGINLSAGRRSLRVVMDAEASHGWVGNFDSFKLIRQP